MKNFKSESDKRVLLADGAIGTYLVSKGKSESINKSLQSLEEPELIKEIHREYIDAGADIITTNTFDANRIKLKDRSHFLENILISSVKHVKDAMRESGKKCFIGGSIGPLGVMLKPYGILSISEMEEIYTEISSILIMEGVDLIILETFGSLVEMKAALNSVRKISDIPVISSMTFNSDGITVFGDTIDRSLLEVYSNGADIVGINCYLGPNDSYNLLIEALKKSGLPLSVMPNAGIPAIVNGKTIYLSSPEYFKEYAKLFLKEGVRVIGSCCGTNPEHTAAMKIAIDEYKLEPKKREKGISKDEYFSDFRNDLGKSFKITVEITPPKSLNYNKTIKKIRKLKEYGINTVNITENPLAKIRMSPTAFSKIVSDETGVEPILHFTLRDRNLLAIQSDLLGAHALGIRNIFAIKGDPAVMGDFPLATTVYDIDTTQLIRLIKNLNEGIDISGKKMRNKTDFLVGTAVNPSNKDYDFELKRVEEKISAGVDYFITQPVFNPEILKKFGEDIEKFNIPVIAGLMEIKDYRYGLFLKNEVPGIEVSDEIIEEFEKNDNKKTGIDIAIRTGKMIKKYCNGVYLISSSGDSDSIIKIIEGIKNG